jgi:hypothetical protein
MKNFDETLTIKRSHPTYHKGGFPMSNNVADPGKYSVGYSVDYLNGLLLKHWRPVPFIRKMDFAMPLKMVRILSVPG